MKKYVPTLKEENEVQIKINKIPPIAVIYNTLQIQSRNMAQITRSYGNAKIF
jgi:hypothetical protein